MSLTPLQFPETGLGSFLSYLWLIPFLCFLNTAAVLSSSLLEIIVTGREPALLGKSVFEIQLLLEEGLSWV